jgi:hypothetical protein
VDQDIWRLQKTRQNPKNLAVLPKVNNRKRPKILKKAPIFYAPQKYSNICRPPKIGHTKKPLKITQNHAKLSQEPTLKKWLFTSRQVLKLTSPLKTCHLAENNIIKALQSPVASAEADSCLRLNIRLFKVSLNFGIRF